MGGWEAWALHPSKGSQGETAPPRRLAAAAAGATGALHLTAGRSPARRHEAMVRSALARPPSAGGRPGSAGPPSFHCPGCLAPFMQLPGSPGKRAAARSAQPPVCGVCHHATVTTEPAAAATALQPGALDAASGAGPAGAPPRPAPCAAPPALEQLLLQLGLSSGWRGLLLQSLQGAQQAAAEADDAGSMPAPALSSPAARPAPKPAQRPAACRLAPGLRAGKPVLGKTEAAAVDEHPHGSPRIAACTAAQDRRAAASGVRAQQAAVAPTDTMGAVIRRNRQLLQHAAAAAAAAAPAPPVLSECRSGQLATEDAEPSALAPAAAADDPEEVLARLACRRHGSPSPPSSPGSDAASEPAPPAVALAPSLSGALTICGSWSSLQGGGSVRGATPSGGAAGAEGLGAAGRHEGDSGLRPLSASSAAGESGGGGYEDDFESASASAAEWE